MARVCHSLAACQRHTPSSLAPVIGLSNNDVIALRPLRSLRCVRCVRWMETPLNPDHRVLHLLAHSAAVVRTDVTVNKC